MLSLKFPSTLILRSSLFIDVLQEVKKIINKNKNTIGMDNKEIKMLSTNFCYGGEEIYEIENLKN